MVTISDVAKRAKVSRSTVSRVLNNQTHHIREETRRAVLKAAEELDFKPNRVARSLKMKKTHCIGVITDDIDTPFLPSMLKAIEQYAFSRGYSALVCNSGYNWNDKRRISTCWWGARWMELSSQLPLCTPIPRS